MVVHVCNRCQCREASRLGRLQVSATVLPNTEQVAVRRALDQPIIGTANLLVDEETRTPSPRLAEQPGRNTPESPSLLAGFT